jgi:SAM-dependent methyltransferase
MAPDYLHGTSESEQQRLEAQAMLFGGSDFLPPLHADMRVLEVGCGTGAIAREVARQVGEIVGVDREAAQIETARRLGYEIENMRLVQGDANRLDFPDATFDAAYCRFVLEHLADPAPSLAEMKRVLKPGGWVCVLEWEPDCIVNHPDSPAVERVWREIYRLQARLGGDPWIGRKLYGLFAEVGFNAVQAEGRAWAITSADSKQLALYLDGAREIIHQTQDKLIQHDAANAAVIEQALNEYRHMSESRAAFVLHAFCRVVGYA